MAGPRFPYQDLQEFLGALESVDEIGARIGALVKPELPRGDRVENEPARAPVSRTASRPSTPA